MSFLLGTQETLSHVISLLHNLDTMAIVQDEWPDRLCSELSLSSFQMSLDLLHIKQEQFFKSVIANGTQSSGSHYSLDHLRGKGEKTEGSWVARVTTATFRSGLLFSTWHISPKSYEFLWIIILKLFECKISKKYPLSCIISQNLQNSKMLSFTFSPIESLWQIVINPQVNLLFNLTQNVSEIHY